MESGVVKKGTGTQFVHLQAGSPIRFSEHFQQGCSDETKTAKSGLFGFWLRFGLVTGFFKPAPSPKPRQKPKILAAPRYIFAINALTFIPGIPGGKSRVVLSGFSVLAQETTDWSEC
jgi:hypothetical protein